ncbi:MAG TPA: alpha/beta hydrolase-fold protein [Longilinea sp.]|nr:alpha/beta hydrolase-fold protein [Longilinea sp.]
MFRQKTTIVLTALILVGLTSAFSALPYTNAPIKAANPPDLQTTPQPETSVTPEDQPLSQTCSETQGQTYRLTSSTYWLEYPLDFTIHLPPCYQADYPGGYPVLYLLHGIGFTDDQWERLGALSAADQLILTGGSRPFIIVFPYERYSLIEPNGSEFPLAIVDNLIPFIDSTYPVCTQRECRAIGGLSRGAAWAVRLGLAYPDLFGYVGAHSLTPFFGDAEDVTSWVEVISSGTHITSPFSILMTIGGITVPLVFSPESEQSVPPVIYLDIGNNDPELQAAREFEEALTQAHVMHEWYLNLGNHDEEYWSEHVSMYMNWYASHWQINP